MLFNSFEYVTFYCIVLTVAWLTAGWSRFRTYFIVVASGYFYASNNGWQILLLLATTTTDYFVCLAMGRTKEEARRKYLVLVSIVSNLGMLAVFKYSNFVGGTVSELATLFGFRVDWVDVHILLPVGISFYTFEALSYTIDVYRRKIPPERDYVRLAFLVSFFPHLIAGPIVRAQAMFPQIGRRPSLSVEGLELALFLIAAGAFKKIVLADSLAPYADAAFSNPREVGTVATWIGVYAFAFQIYFDFSGYTDIALGSAKLLGYELPANFNRPYAAISITDFWRRWHMSLSTWLRDYLYISLGGNRMPTKWGVYRNLILTMLLGGLWHGAAWHFALWGFLHGLWLSIERAVGIERGQQGSASQTRSRDLLRTVAVFHGVLALWAVFRAESLSALWMSASTMVSYIPGRVTNGMALAVAVMALAWAWQVVTERNDLKARFLSLPIPVKVVSYVAATFVVLIFNSDTPQAFIYFRF
jgi:alginate O-acetyltransferase complex protein AlgI